MPPSTTVGPTRNSSSTADQARLSKSATVAAGMMVSHVGSAPGTGVSGPSDAGGGVFAPVGSIVGSGEGPGAGAAHDATTVIAAAIARAAPRR